MEICKAGRAKADGRQPADADVGLESGYCAALVSQVRRRQPSKRVSEYEIYLPWAALLPDPLAPVSWYCLALAIAPLSLVDLHNACTIRLN